MMKFEWKKKLVKNFGVRENSLDSVRSLWMFIVERRVNGKLSILVKHWKGTLHHSWYILHGFYESDINICYTLRIGVLSANVYFRSFISCNKPIGREIRILIHKFFCWRGFEHLSNKICFTNWVKICHIISFDLCFSTNKWIAPSFPQ